MEMMQSHNQQESILVGCVLPTCNDLICFNSHPMSALVEEGNKFKQVSSDGHQTLLAGGWGSGHVQGGAEVPCPEGGSQGWVGWGGGLCTVSSNVSWTMITWDPHEQTDRPMDRRVQKHYLLANSMAGGKMGTSEIWTHVNILFISVLF